MNILDLCDDVLGLIGESVKTKRRHNKVINELISCDEELWWDLEDKGEWEECRDDEQDDRVANLMAILKWRNQDPEYNF